MSETSEMKTLVTEIADRNNHIKDQVKDISYQVKQERREQGAESNRQFAQTP